jgi:hypothetical protein
VKKLLVLFLIFIAGCTTTYKDMKSWEGHTVKEMYWDMGPPDTIEELGSGYRVMTWIRTWTKDGKVRTCRRSFTVVLTGYDEEVTDTSYSDCPFITYKSK